MRRFRAIWEKNKQIEEVAKHVREDVMMKRFSDCRNCIVLRCWLWKRFVLSSRRDLVDSLGIFFSFVCIELCLLCTGNCKFYFEIVDSVLVKSCHRFSLLQL